MIETMGVMILARYRRTDDGGMGDVDVVREYVAFGRTKRECETLLLLKANSFEVLKDTDDTEESEYRAGDGFVYSIFPQWLASVSKE